MWQFGCTLYLLSSGRSVFQTDNQENVTPDEVPKIAQWENNEKAQRMALIGHGWPRRLISKLLSKDPLERPRSWDYVLKQLGAEVSESAMNIRACSVYHLNEILLPACNQALQSQLADSEQPLGCEPYLQCVEDGTIWHMVQGYTKAASKHHRSSYADSLDKYQMGADHVGDATALLSYSWYYNCS